MNNQYMTARPTGPAAFGYGANAGPAPPHPTQINDVQQPQPPPQQNVLLQQHGQPPNISGPLQPQRGAAPFQSMPQPGIYQPPGTMQPGKQAQFQSPPNYSFSGGGVVTPVTATNANNYVERQNGADRPTPPMPPQQLSSSQSFPPNAMSGPMSMQQQPIHQTQQGPPPPHQQGPPPQQPGFAGRMPTVKPFVQPAAGRGQQFVNQMGNMSLGEQQQQQQQQPRPMGPPLSSGFQQMGPAASMQNKPPPQQSSVPPYNVTAGPNLMGVTPPSQYQHLPVSSVPPSRSQQLPGPPPPPNVDQQRYNTYGSPPGSAPHPPQQQHQLSGPPISHQPPPPPPSDHYAPAQPGRFPAATSPPGVAAAAAAAHNLPPTVTYSPNNAAAPTYEAVNGYPGPPGVHQSSYGVGPTPPPPQMGQTQFIAAAGPYQGQPAHLAQRLPPSQIGPPGGQQPPPPQSPANQQGFNQGYQQRMAPGGQMQPPQQQQRRLDPEMMPSPIQVIEDDRKNREGVFSTNERGAVPPLVTTNFVTEDQGNCNPRFMRSSMYSVPNSPDMMKQSSIPFTLTISPFAKLVEGEVAPPTVNLGELGPVRCVRCKAYMCPYMQFIDGGRRFQCNFCRATTDVPAEYFSHLDHTGQRVDKYERPELCLGSYEFVATKDYCKNNIFPRPPAFIFIVDVSYNSIRSGVVHLLCENMKDVLANLPRHAECEESQIEVGFITYSSSVHFYNLKSCLAQPQAMVVPDVQDMFVPLLDGFLVGLRESENLIDSLVEQIPKIFQDCRDTEIILGPAIKAGLEALKAADRSGKLFVFHSSLPIADAPGRLKNRDDRKLLGTDKEKTILAPQNVFYNQLGQDCVAAACSVDLFTFPNAYIDIATIGQVCRLSGGQIHKYTYFQPEIDGARFVEDLKRSVRRQVAFDGIMRVRTSTGIRPTEFYGNYFMSNTTDVELAAIDSDKAISVEIKHDDKLNEEDAVYIQAAILYTSVGGQRRLRIHNLSLNTCSQMADLYRNCELDALMNYYSKASLRKLCDQTPKQVREDLISKCATSLACYRKNCANPSSAGQLILPECMKLLPLYGNCLLKSDAIAGGSDMTIDDRSFAMHALNSMDVASSLNYIYPRLIPVHDLDSNTFSVPTALRCSVEKLKENGVYLLENGIYMFMWIGANVEVEWLVNVFGVQSLAQIDVDKPSLPEFNNPTSLRLCRLVARIREERPRYLKLMVIRQRDKLEVVFKHFLVEDKGMDNSPSYVDFLCHVHKEIRNLLS